MMDGYWDAFHSASDPNRAQRESQDRSTLAQLQQMQGVQKLVESSADRQRQQAARAAIAGLPPSATGEQVMSVLRPFMEPKDIAAGVQNTENKKLQIDANKQAALARLAHSASTAQSLHQYRMGMLTKQEDRNAEIERHNGEVEQLQRDAQALTGQRISLGVAQAAFNQRNAAANTAFNTGATVAPTVNAPPQGATSSPATTTMGRLMAGGQPITDPTEQANATAVMDASRAGQPFTLANPEGSTIGALASPPAARGPMEQGSPMPVPPPPQAGQPIATPQPADAANLDANDLRARAKAAFDVDRASASAASAPEAVRAATAEQPVTPGPVMPKFSGSPREVASAENRWRLAQEAAKNKIDAKVNLAGGRESVFINRVVSSGNQAAADLENVVKLPMTASRGFFGGRGQKEGILNAGKETLANAMTTQEVQTYNVFATGFQRALAAIEGAGLAPTNALMHQMDQVIFKEGDTNFTKLAKLAQTRQIVEKGLETVVANSRVDAETKKLVEKIVEKVQKAVPFTGSDLLALQKEQLTNPAATLSDVMGQMKAGTGGWDDSKEKRYQELLRKRGGS